MKRINLNLDTVEKAPIVDMRHALKTTLMAYHRWDNEEMDAMPNDVIKGLVTSALMQERFTKINPILLADSYKSSHWKQYPPGAKGYFGYIEARKPAKSEERRIENMLLDMLKQHWTKAITEKDIENIKDRLREKRHFDEAVFFGLQIFIKKVLLRPITIEDVNYAEEFLTSHGEPFNRAGWEYIVKKHNGYIPIRIKAVPEGLVVKEGNALVTVESTDPEVFWVGGYLETMLLRAVWYGTTVATISREAKKIILKYLNMTSDDPRALLMFKLHDFGGRGVSSSESAGIGGCAHLVNFMGSDTLEGVLFARLFYGEKMAAFSIPAAEHSTITSWGRVNEVKAFENMVDLFGKPGAIFAVVSDSYDIENACEFLWGEKLREKVIKSGATLVVRPDSGEPAPTVLRCLQLLESKFGVTINKKGYKVLNYVRIIQGDGINLESIAEICQVIVDNGYSLDNVNFGMGGALLQHMNRDTLRFAMKMSAILIDGVWHDVSKSPIGDPMKKSKGGRLMLYQYLGKGGNTEHITLREGDLPKGEEGKYTEALFTVYEDGKLIQDQTLFAIRNRAQL